MLNRALPLLVGLALTASVAAQDRPDDPVTESDQAPPLYVADVSGTVSLTRSAQTETVSADMPLIEGDRLRTDRGRLELRDDAGELLFLDEGSLLDVTAPGAVRLLAGRTRLISASRADGTPLRVDTPNATVRPYGPADVRVDVSVGPRGDTTAVIAVSGAADLSTEWGDVRVEAGQRVVAVGVGRPDPATRAASGDAFDRWVADRLGASQPTESASYLPDRLESYSATLDQHGAWETDPQYGSVWYPAVTVGWRPFSSGHWAHAGYLGWVWIGDTPWSWPTHHYGRWGWRHDRWFWVPARSWAPAWVAWGIGPGYVGWCPLGWDNRPVFALSFGNVTYYRGGRDFYRRWDGYAAGRAYDPHYGWTVLAARDFRPGVAVRRHAVDWRRLPEGTRSAFATQRVPPHRGTITTDGGRVGAGPRWAPPPTHYGIPRENAARTHGPGGLTVAAPPSRDRAAPRGSALDRGRRAPPSGSAAGVEAPDDRDPPGRTAVSRDGRGRAPYIIRRGDAGPPSPATGAGAGPRGEAPPTRVAPPPSPVRSGPPRQVERPPARTRAAPPAPGIAAGPRAPAGRAQGRAPSASTPSGSAPSGSAPSGSAPSRTAVPRSGPRPR